MRSLIRPSLADVHLTDGFKASGTSPPESKATKICSTCNQEKTTTSFYSKGNRIDSACKVCQKQKKKTKYVALKNCDAVAGLTSILQITAKGITDRIKAEIKKLDEVILCRQKLKL